jgi:hypothetical protein
MTWEDATTRNSGHFQVCRHFEFNTNETDATYQSCVKVDAKKRKRVTKHRSYQTSTTVTNDRSPPWKRSIIWILQSREQP